MKPGVKKRWLKALRSGEYKQTTGRLTTARKEFCCLGVLCEVEGVEPVLQRGHGYLYDGETTSLTDKLKKRWGLTDEDHYTLAALNDIRGSSFAEIADYIEESL